MAYLVKNNGVNPDLVPGSNAFNNPTENARTRLIEERVPVGLLAEQLGYSSEAAFSRAFKRVVGASPGTVRNQGFS